MLKFRKKDLVKHWLFYDIYNVIYAEAKYLYGSRETRNNIEEKGDKQRLLEFKHAK